MRDPWKDLIIVAKGDGDQGKSNFQFSFSSFVLFILYDRTNFRIFDVALSA